MSYLNSIVGMSEQSKWLILYEVQFPPPTVIMAPREPSSLCEQIRLFICIILYMLVFLLPPTNDQHTESAFMNLGGTYSLTHPSLKVILSLHHVLSQRRNTTFEVLVERVKRVENHPKKIIQPKIS